MKLVNFQKVLFHRARGIHNFKNYETFRKVVFDLGFNYATKKHKKYLVEKKDIALKRFTYLRRYHEYVTVDEPLYFIYQDESFIFVYGTGKGKIWHDNTAASNMPEASSLGPRYIICDIGGAEGFIEGAGMFKKSCKDPKPDDDYHGDMTGVSWHRWFTERALPNLQKPCLIIMDNAPYYTVQAIFP